MLLNHWHYSFLSLWPSGTGTTRFVFLPLIVALGLIELTLKGFALWRAGRLNQPGWFVALLVTNTAGIFPLIYLIVTKDTKK